MGKLTIKKLLKFFSKEAVRVLRPRGGKKPKTKVLPRPETALARRLDYYTLLVLAWLLTGVFLNNLMEISMRFWVLLILATWTETKGLQFVRNRLGQWQRDRLQRNLAEKHHREFLRNLSPSEFAIKAGELLASYSDDFRDLRVWPPNAAGNDAGMFLEGYRRAERILIQCAQTDLSTGKDLDHFISLLEQARCREGVFVTTGRFEPVARKQVKRAKNRYSLSLVDGRQLVTLSHKFGQVPKGEQELGTVADSAKHSGMGLPWWEELLWASGQRAGSYFWSGLALLFIPWFFGPMFHYHWLYFLCGFLVLALGAGGLIYHRMLMEAGDLL